MSPADIIARAIETQAWAALGIGDTLAYKNRRISSERKAPRILSALTTAGYRIIAPGAYDARTVEACAKVADDEEHDFSWAGTTATHNLLAKHGAEIAAAIRKLAGEGT